MADRKVVSGVILGGFLVLILSLQCSAQKESRVEEKSEAEEKASVLDVKIDKKIGLLFPWKKTPLQEVETPLKDLDQIEQTKKERYLERAVTELDTEKTTGGSTEGS